jgi:hypothetical protein
LDAIYFLAAVLQLSMMMPMTEVSVDKNTNPTPTASGFFV